MDAYDRVRASSACKNNVKAHLDKRRPDKKHGTSLPCVDESLLLHRVVWMCLTLPYPSLPFSEFEIEERVTHAAHSAWLSVFDGKGRCKKHDWIYPSFSTYATSASCLLALAEKTIDAFRI